MDIRYAANPNDVKRYTTEELRKEFLIENLYVPDTVVAVYSHVDRMVTLGCMPVKETVSIDKGIDIWANFGTHYFLERREIGIFNIGGAGKITVDGTVYELGYKDCLYITMGAKEVLFSSDDASKPAKFYMVSAPAHRSYETKLLKIADANKKPLGDMTTSNKRVINQFIHPAVLKTCQLSMGMTVLEPGSVWNTMPAHTHERRGSGRLPHDGPGTGDPPHRHDQRAGRHFPVLVDPRRGRHLRLHLYLGHGRREPGIRRHGRYSHKQTEIIQEERSTWT